MKKVWLSVLGKEEDTAKGLMEQAKKYGLAMEGHFWSDNLEKMEWMGPRPELIAKDTSLWVIAGTSEQLQAPETRFGLSLLALTVQAARGHGFPVIFLHQGEPPDLADLPTPLGHLECAPLSAAAGPKLVAKANIPFTPAPADYRMDVYGLAAGLGLWFEVGPRGHDWKGAMFGVAPGEVVAHGVDKRGELPRGKMVLNYPMKGLKIGLGEKEYHAWAVKNPIDSETSYFIKVDGMPESILFGEFSEDDDAEVFAVRLI